MSVTVNKVYGKGEGKVFQDKMQTCRHITWCLCCDPFQIYG